MLGFGANHKLGVDEAENAICNKKRNKEFENTEKHMNRRIERYENGVTAHFGESDLVNGCEMSYCEIE